LKRKLTNWKHR